MWGASQPYDMVGNTVTRIGRTSRGREPKPLLVAAILGVVAIVALVAGLHPAY